MPSKPRLKKYKNIAIIEKVIFAGCFFATVGVHDKTALRGAHSKTVLRLHGMEEVGVRFPVSPQFVLWDLVKLSENGRGFPTFLPIFVERDIWNMVVVLFPAGTADFSAQDFFDSAGIDYGRKHNDSIGPPNCCK